MTYDGLTDALGQSQILPYLRGLKDLGHRISILSFEKQGKNHSIPRLSEKLEEQGLQWFPLKYTKSPPILSTLKDLVVMSRRAKALFKESSYDIVHCRSYITALVGLRLKRQFGVKLIFDMRGFWADERVEGNIWPQQNLVYKRIYKFFKKKEKEMLREADSVICLTNNASDEIASWPDLPGIAKKIEVIPCCVEDTLFDPNRYNDASITSLRSQLSFDSDDFVICYLGSLGTWYMLEEMLDFFVVMLKKKPESKFLFLSGDEREYILAEAKKRKLENNIQIRFVEREDVPKMISICDYGIFFIKPVYSKKASSPTKLAELLSMGKPVICNTGVGDVDRIVAEGNAGFIVDEFSVDGYESVVNKMAEAGNYIPSALESAREFSLAMGINSYHTVYKSIINNVVTGH